MTEPEHVPREKLTAVFARQDFYEACKRRCRFFVPDLRTAAGLVRVQMYQFWAALTNGHQVGQAMVVVRFSENRATTR